MEFPPEPDTPSSPDPFNPDSLRLDQDFSAQAGVKKVVTTVVCRKPNRQEFVRVRPGEKWRLQTAVFDDKANREMYLVDKSLWPELMTEISLVCLFVAIARNGVLFVWPVKLPAPDGKSNSWNDSALSAAQLAESKWVRMSANMSANMYDVFEACGALTEPVWPELTFEELLRLAFKERFIRDADHPIVRSLRGEV